jgi:hypothetical protein
VQLCCASLVNIVSTEVPFQRHAVALRSNTGLQHNLVEVLASALHAAAIELQLPADRRPGVWNWFKIDQVVSALVKSTLQYPLSQQLASSFRGMSPFAPRILQSAAQLCAAVPASCPDEMNSSRFAGF